jgi:hypothetical protein
MYAARNDQDAFVVCEPATGCYRRFWPKTAIAAPALRALPAEASLGWKLVQILAGQLLATVDVSRAEGTEFTVTFAGPKTLEDRQA